MSSRLEFGKVPKGEYIGPTLGEIEDEIERLGLPDHEAYEAYLVDSEHGFYRGDLEAEQIHQFLNKVGLIKAGQEIHIGATDDEIRRNREKLIGRFARKLKGFF